ncbi:hypothetical protein QP991_07180, partial [Corynebacterium amycolatum]|uniref:hypothetical protein n=1 Tax=Corynebacterium amycolatum TaxID=43765 RepID=UPI00254FCBC5
PRHPKRLDQITATRPEKTHFSLLNPKLATALVMQQKDREGISTFPVCIVRHQGLEPRTR